ncbi:OmpW/AlkL family protein [Dyella ginsengisoli]|uniref:OmpW/AlkL family protein n=1 Tax=Dyella ginsengisoli TaxID=363848 RepID=UPI0018E25F9E|nr:OmpW family outer membrane protein [Dyella ginsengisoli]
MKNEIEVLVLVCGMAMAGGVQAQESSLSKSPWSVGVGVVDLQFHPSATLYAGGMQVPGAEIRVDHDDVLGVEIAYALTDHWAARLDIGSPVKTSVIGSGPIAALGKLGGVKGGPAILTLTWSPGMLGPIRPYFGGGMTYLKVFSTSDGAVQNLKIDSNFGAALTVGADWPLSNGFSIGASVQKLLLDTTAHGNAAALGGAPVNANITLDPVVTFLALRKQF